MQREIITIHVKMDRQTFRRFALFDTFRLKKRWCKPALFCAILLVFAAVAFAAGREQSALIGSVLLLVGLGLPAVYVGTYLSQLNAQAKKLRLDPPRPVYTLRLAQEGVTIQNDMKAEATVSLEWKNIHAAWRDKGCIYLYATPARAFLLPDGQADATPPELWAFLAAHLAKERLHQK